ncbi:hypothetical protein STRDD11_00247 [Streptococcus sp. DD11]|uniref:MarR family winged helix-turn-helix transcriptional regulator n=1 Tax=Streptococcus sp. DD11 TaxID=1777879 RepID=UPI0007998C55|nr:MarR family transcriptional regulator [Streptococcus sp. DD11]KXT85709.1 hypothetical protein STRDD11_00247 [Streptococcus sp. DD11]
MRQEFRSLMKSVNRVEFVFEAIQKSLGEKGKLGWLFYVLDDGQAHSQKQLSKDWMIPRSTLNAIVKKAEEEGFVELRPVPKTRRELEILLTEKGKAAADELLQPYIELEDQALAETAEKYSHHFVEVFDYFSKNLEQKIIQGIMEQERDF